MKKLDVVHVVICVVPNFGIYSDSSWLLNVLRQSQSVVGENVGFGQVLVDGRSKLLQRRLKKQGEEPNISAKPWWGGDMILVSFCSWSLNTNENIVEDSD